MICSLQWAEKKRHVVTGHGLPHHKVISWMWEFPSLSPIYQFTGHSDRVLHLALNPDNTRIFSTAADQRFHIWDLQLPASWSRDIHIDNESLWIRTGYKIYYHIRAHCCQESSNYHLYALLLSWQLYQRDCTFPARHLYHTPKPAHHQFTPFAVYHTCQQQRFPALLTTQHKCII